MVDVSLNLYDTIFQQGPEHDDVVVLNKLLFYHVEPKYHDQDARMINPDLSSIQSQMTKRIGGVPVEIDLVTSVGIYFSSENKNYSRKDRFESYEDFGLQARKHLNADGKVLIEFSGTLEPLLSTSKYHDRSRQTGLSLGYGTTSSRALEALVSGSIDPLVGKGSRSFSGNRMIIDEPKPVIMQKAGFEYRHMIRLLYTDFHPDLFALAQLEKVFRLLVEYKYAEPIELIRTNESSSNPLQFGLNLINSVRQKLESPEEITVEKERLSLIDISYSVLEDTVQPIITQIRDDLVSAGVDMDYLDQVRSR